MSGSSTVQEELASTLAGALAVLLATIVVIWTLGTFGLGCVVELGWLMGALGR